MSIFESAPQPWPDRTLALLRIVAALIFITSGTTKVLGFPPSPVQMPPIPAMSQIWIGAWMEVIGGSLSGVSYDPQTGTISYDGNAAASWGLVQLTASTRGARSNAFFVRVLSPDAVWGQDATKRDDIARKCPGARKFD